MYTAQIVHNMKQIIIINQALKLPEERWTIQVAQASAGAFLEADKDARKTWLKEGKPRIVLNVFDEKDLWDLLSKAEHRSLPTCLVEDTTGQAIPAGSTFACLGIGPADDAQIDQLAEVLTLYRWVRENVVNARFLG